MFFGIRRKRASRNRDTSVSVDGTSSDLAVCVVHNPVARVGCGSIPRRSDRCSANALRLGTNALVMDTNAGSMPVIGMPSSVHPTSPMWHGATFQTRLPLLADQARLGLFSVGDIALLLGGIIIVATCSLRMFERARKPSCEVHSRLSVQDRSPTVFSAGVIPDQWNDLRGSSSTARAHRSFDDTH